MDCYDSPHTPTPFTSTLLKEVKFFATVWSRERKENKFLLDVFLEDKAPKMLNIISNRMMVYENKLNMMSVFII